MEVKNPFLELRNINFYYDSLKVLKNVRLTINASEVHAIVGEHGAGKSSLCMIMGGFRRPHSGDMFLEGELCDGFSPKRAQKAGIELVSQHNPVIESFTVADNLFLDNRGISNSPFIGNKKHHELAEGIIKRFNFNLDPDEKLKNLKLSDRVLVDILKHIYQNPKLLILDEALQKLTTVNLKKITQLLHELKNRGTAILFVTHRIDDIYNLADRVSILKNGELIISDSVKNIDKINLIKLAYTQIIDNDTLANWNKEFYSLLKYNEAVLQKLPVNLIVVDKKNNIKLINENAKAYFNVEESFFLNMPIRNLFYQQNRTILDLIVEILEGEEVKLLYNQTLKRNNEESIINIKVHPIYDETFLIGHYIIIEDITEHEKLREHMLLSEKLASIGLLSAGVAHEINNPLEIICNNLRFLKYKIEESPLLETVTSIEEEIESISDIVNNLITFSDKNTDFLEIIDINTIILDLINLVRHSAAHQRITIEFRERAEKAFLRIKRTEFRQVMLNLMKNSFEAMQSGGIISIRTKVIVNGDDRKVAVYFRDTGNGIQNKNINDIFLPFYSMKQEQPGNMGLGLSVSYGIVKKYGGIISVANLDDGGCEFSIVFPIEGIEIQASE